MSKIIQGDNYNTVEEAVASSDDYFSMLVFSALGNSGGMHLNNSAGSQPGKFTFSLAKDNTFNRFGDDEEEDEEDLRGDCKKSPCCLNDLNPIFDGIELASAEEATKKEMCFQMYKQAMVFLFRPHLGKGVRKELPTCVVHRIREKFPEHSSDYTGFKEATLSE